MSNATKAHQRQRLKILRPKGGKLFQRVPCDCQGGGYSCKLFAGPGQIAKIVKESDETAMFAFPLNLSMRFFLKKKHSQTLFVSDTRHVS